MLWKKESPAPDAMYIDLFKLTHYNMEVELNVMIRNEKDLRPHYQKDDKIAEKNRLKGNASYRAGEWSLAMAYYNESLRFVESGSQHLMSFAYANRASCFLQLKMFEKCLNDIELAVAAGYPEEQMSKLEKRRAECLQRMESGEQSRRIGAKLSFPPSPDFPDMANVLHVETDPTSGRTKVVAKQDIDVDQTIVVEDALFPYLHEQFGWKCNVCLKAYENLTPCSNCATALFCSNCQGHVLHGYECGLNMCGEGEFNRDMLHYVRIILSTIGMFGTIDELMAFVETHLQPSHDGNGQPKQMRTELRDLSKYQVYLNTAVPKKSIDKIYDGDDTRALGIYPVFRTVLQVPHIRAMFQTQKRLRFLMHLIGQNLLNFPDFTHFASLKFTKMSDPNSVSFDAGFYQMEKYFQHSCYPNTLAVVGNGQQAMITARPIKKGEQVFASCIPIALEPADERHKLCLNRIGVKCECKRCQGVTAEKSQRLEMLKNPVYRNFLSRLEQNNSTGYDEIIDDDCVKLLRNFGRMNWCDEIKKVLQVYQGALYNRIAGDVIKQTKEFRSS